MKEVAKGRRGRGAKGRTTGIEWTDCTWNCVIGCTPVSPGCLNCYAAVMARRLEAMGKREYQPRVLDGDRRIAIENEQRKGKTYATACVDAKPVSVRIAEVKNGRAVFIGEVRTLPDRLLEPLKWKTPRRVFVNSMSDLFHEDVAEDFIARVFAIMAHCHWHTFQVLTKRPERMASVLNGENFIELVKMHMGHVGPIDWPLPNVWLGTSVEDQARADERIPHLLRCPAAVRFLSCEPLIGAVDLRSVVNGAETYKPLTGKRRNAFTDAEDQNHSRLHWVIVGGESGHDARACDVAWIRSIVTQCSGAGVPVFVKQLGGCVDDSDSATGWFICPKCHQRRDDYDVLGLDPGTCQCHACGEIVDIDDNEQKYDKNGAIKLRDRKGGDVSEWPEDLRVREWPDADRGFASIDKRLLKIKERELCSTPSVMRPSESPRTSSAERDSTASLST